MLAYVCLRFPFYTDLVSWTVQPEGSCPSVSTGDSRCSGSWRMCMPQSLMATRPESAGPAPYERTCGRDTVRDTWTPFLGSPDCHPGPRLEETTCVRKTRQG